MRAGVGPYGVRAACLIAISYEKRKIMSFAKVMFAPQGDYMELCMRDTGRVPVVSQRGKVTGFSWRSRSRLNKMIAKLKKTHIPLFVTLTYHERYPTDFIGYKSHLDLFLKRLSYHFKSSGVIWKLEFQDRGAPHFHLLVFGVDFNELADFVPSAWQEVVDPGNDLLLRWHRGELGHGNRHCVQEIRSWQGVKSYASKYFSKTIDFVEGQGTGRCWGSRGFVPFSEILELKINMTSALMWRRGVSRGKHFKMRRFGFWMFGYHVDWLLYLNYCIDAFVDDKNVPPNFPPGWFCNIPESRDVVTDVQ